MNKSYQDDLETFFKLFRKLSAHPNDTEMPAADGAPIPNQPPFEEPNIPSPITEDLRRSNIRSETMESEEDQLRHMLEEYVRLVSSLGYNYDYIDNKFVRSRQVTAIHGKLIRAGNELVHLPRTFRLLVYVTIILNRISKLVEVAHQPLDVSD